MRTSHPRIPWSTPSPSPRSSRPPRWRKRPRPPPPPRRTTRHRERRPIQRIHLPGHLPDRRQARRARRLRLGAFERLLSRHLGIEHQLARGFRRSTRAPASNGTSTAATRQFPDNDDWNYDVGTIYYYYPGTRNPGFVNANTWEIYAAINWKWLGAKASYSLDDYFGAQPTGKKTDGTWYFDFYATIPSANRVHAARALRDPQRQ